MGPGRMAVTAEPFAIAAGQLESSASANGVTSTLSVTTPTNTGNQTFLIPNEAPASNTNYTICIQGALGCIVSGGLAGGQTLIGGTATTDSLTLQSTSASAGGTSYIYFKTGNNGGTTAMTILNNGYVGIGTSNIDTKLKVGGTVRVTESTGVEAIDIAPSLTLNSIYSNYYGGSGGVDIPLVLGTFVNKSNQLYLATSGYVGVGTNNPSDVLQIAYNGNTYMNINATTGSGQVAGIKLQRGAYATDNYTDWSMYDSGGNLYFDDSDNTIGTKTALTITGDSGAVGIGSTNAAGLLSVGASNQFQVSATGAVTAVGVDAGTGLLQGTGGLTITGNTSLTAGTITLTANAASTWGTTSGNLTLQSNSSNNLLLNPNGGNVGIGTVSPSSLLSLATNGFTLPNLTLSLNAAPSTVSTFSNLNFYSQNTVNSGWVDVGGVGGANYILAATPDTTTGAVFAAGSGGFIYKCLASTTCGSNANWSSLGNVTGGNTVNSLLSDSATTALYAGVSGGSIYRCLVSTGCGASANWSSAASFTSNVNTLMSDSVTSALYTGTSNGTLYKCLTSSGCSAGGNWVSVGIINGGSSISSLLSDSTTSALYAGSGNTHIYKCLTSTGCGASANWSDAGSLGSFGIFSLVHDNTTAALYAGGYGVIYKCLISTGCGTNTNWVSVGTVASSSDIWSIISDSTSSALYASAGNGHIYKCLVSTGCGSNSNWADMGNISSGSSINVLISSNLTGATAVFAGSTNAHVYKFSTNFTPSNIDYATLGGLAVNTTAGSRTGWSDLLDLQRWQPGHCHGCLW